MAFGTIKWFNDRKGYGFIEPEAGKRDVFVHISAVRLSGLETLIAGERYEYEVQQLGDGRVVAMGLKLVSVEVEETSSD